MIGEALFVGLGETVRQMRAAMDRGRNAIEGAGKGAAKGTAKP
jgi:pyridoxine 5-phosphate synthase